MQAEVTALWVAVLTALITIIPIAAGLIVTWLKLKEQELQISKKPTTDQVVQQIDNKIAAYANEGTSNVSQLPGPGNSGGGVTTS